MKRLTTITTVLLLVMALPACKSKSNTQTTEAQDTALRAEGDVTLTVDTKASEIEWIGHKVGGSHHGIVKLQSDEVSGNPETSTLSSGTFVIDMNSIDCQDLKGEMKEMLENHLKSADFFEVETYPTATFEITLAERIADTDKYTISGNLTMKATTNNVTFEATLAQDNSTYTAQSDTIRIDRTEWGVNYGSKNIFKNLKDNTINDQMEIVLSIVAR